MASNNNLVSVPVVDKNGVLTTRWKRAEATAGPIPVIPPVSAASPTPSTNLQAEVSISTAFIKSLWASVNPQRGKEATLTRYLNLPEDVRDNIQNALGREDANMTMPAMMIVKMLAGRSTSDQMIDDVATYLASTERETIKFAATMFAPSSSTEVQYQPLQIDITGLRYYRLQGFSYDPDLPIRKQTETTRKQIAALFKLHAFAYSLPTYMESGLEPVIRITANNVIEPYWLAGYAVEKPDMVDLMIDLIKERNVADKEFLLSVLTTESLSMKDGVL